MCIFCEIAKGNIKSHVVYEDDVCMAFLDLSQATLGHTLVIPKTHYTNIFDVKEEVLSHMIGVAKKIALRLSETLGVTDINILNNSGARAGQSVMHFHIHIIPRYDNDNFSFAFKSNKLTEKEFLDLTNKIKF